MLNVRLQLEITAIPYTARYIDKEGIEVLKRDIAKMSESLDNGDFEKYHIYHREFHMHSFSFCNISYLVKALSDALDHHERGLNIFKLRSWREQPNINEHVAILNALEKHDERAAVKYLLNNKKTALKFFEEQLKDLV